MPGEKARRPSSAASSIRSVVSTSCRWIGMDDLSSLDGREERHFVFVFEHVPAFLVFDPDRDEHRPFHRLHTREARPGKIHELGQRSARGNRMGPYRAAGELFKKGKEIYRHPDLSFGSCHDANAIELKARNARNLPPAAGVPNKAAGAARRRRGGCGSARRNRDRTRPQRRRGFRTPRNPRARAEFAWTACPATHTRARGAGPTPPASRARGTSCCRYRGYRPPGAHHGNGRPISGFW